MLGFSAQPTLLLASQLGADQVISLKSLFRKGFDIKIELSTVENCGSMS